MLHLLSNLGRWLRTSGLFWWRYPVTARPDEDLGKAGEQAAARYLYSLGYQIVAQRHRQRHSEIDIIAIDGEEIVFVEVKTWRDAASEDPSAAVGPAKQRQLTRAALVYLKKHNLLDRPARFDVVSVIWSDASAEPRIRHFPHAFEATGEGPFFA